MASLSVDFSAEDHFFRGETPFDTQILKIDTGLHQGKGRLFPIPIHYYEEIYFFRSRLTGREQTTDATRTNMIGAIICRQKIRIAFKALNARDIDSFISSWADASIFIYPGKLSVSGEFRGKAVIRSWFINFLEQFPEYEITLNKVTVSNLFDFIGTNTVTVEWEMKGKNRQGVAFTNSGVTVVDIVLTKPTRITDFVFDYDMLKAAWGE